MFYQKILKPIFFKFNPELIHNIFVYIGEFLGKNSITRGLVGLFYGYKGRDISKTVDGLTFKTPFILSSGFDYNGRLLNILPEVSFGGVEIGSITARPCEGNKKPRLKRLPKSQSLIVNKGLRNDGVEAVIRRLKKIKQAENFVVGISLARTNDNRTCDTKEGIADYFYSFKRLNEENIGDYYALNISCPNSFGGESFADPKILPDLLQKLSSVKCDKPVYVKMPINLEWSKFRELLEVLNRFKMIRGVIIGNLNKNYSDLDFQDEAPEGYCGGLSGKPCSELSNNLIKQTKASYGRRFTIIGCGGVMSVENMKEKFKAGSDLVQLITGMIYNGPGFIKELSEAYSKNEKS